MSVFVLYEPTPAGVRICPITPPFGRASEMDWRGVNPPSPQPSPPFLRGERVQGVGGFH
jgi:hypothetical protein